MSTANEIYDAICKESVSRAAMTRELPGERELDRASSLKAIRLANSIVASLKKETDVKVQLVAFDLVGMYAEMIRRAS